MRRERFRAALLGRLDPEKAAAWRFEPVKADALKASAGGTDFAGLFLGFSFFLIAAALLLVGLLFRLNLDRRGPEVGILLASGYRHAAVRRLLLTEGAILAGVGAAVGIGAALGYATLLVRWLGAVWPGGTLRSFLQPHADFGLSLGYRLRCVASLVSMLTILWARARLSKVSPPGCCSRGRQERRAPRSSGRGGVGRIAAVGVILAGAALLAAGPFVHDHEAKAGTFFGAGALLLTAALAALSGWMRSRRHATVEGGGWWAVERLGIRNAARNPLRSMLTAGLLASAAFLIVAVEAFRRTADASESGVKSPSGGFTLLAESELPVFQDLNSDESRAPRCARNSWPTTARTAERPGRSGAAGPTRSWDLKESRSSRSGSVPATTPVA